MSRSASGAYSLPAAYNPVVTKTKILSAWANTTLADMGQEITNSLDRNGRGAMLAPLQLFSGSSLAPGEVFSAETTVGWYRAASADWRWAQANLDTARLTAQGFMVYDVPNGNSYRAGFRELPQRALSADYTGVLADAGYHWYHPTTDATPRTWTIPANATVAFPIGTALTFVNDTGAGVVSIAITSDTMVLAGVGSSGTRTLAANGVATAIKVTATRWVISGTGLT